MHRPSHQNAAIEIRDVTVGYTEGKPVLSGLSASFKGRSLVWVQGGNGAGKSTLVELCSGYLPPWQGTVQINGMDAGTPEARSTRRICRTQPALYPDMTVRDHIVLASRCARADMEAGLIRAVRLGLEPWLDHAAKTLSTGNTRKLWYVMCTLGDFDCVVLDEPFNGIDQESVEKVAEEICQWGGERLVLLISHTLPPGLTVTDDFHLHP
ncbi:ATP-binding cassette domain-containing protein [Streptomyces sp. NPDC057555]|uniref:ABC transporter ATP-binding protein n=1 Tax=Streptomyces sp. NPDC057555 TaxID=3346166 RepID=UPI0036C13CED